MENFTPKLISKDSIKTSNPIENVQFTNMNKSYDQNFIKVITLSNNNNNLQNKYIRENNECNNEMNIVIKIQKHDEKIEYIVKVKKYGCWIQYLGIIFAIWSSIFFSLVLLLVKLLNVYHPFSLSVWRQFGNIIASIPIIIYYRYWKKNMIFDQVWPIIGSNDNMTNVFGLALRGFLSGVAVILRFYSLEYLTIADSTVITYSGPIFIVIMAHFFLKEKCGVTAIITGIWTLLGVILICRPPFLTGSDADINILIGTGITLVVVLCQSTVTILVRKIRKIHFSVMTLSFGICGFFLSLILSISTGVFSIPEGPVDICLTILLATLSFLGQICVILALKLEQAGCVSLIRTCDVLFAFLWQIIFLDILPDLFSILGGSIVMIGVLVTAFKKWISVLPDEDIKKHTFRFLLK